MTLSTVFAWRPLRRESLSEPNHGIALVVALMMALVFAPVLGLHFAASEFGGHGATAAAPASVDLAAEPRSRPGAG